MISVKHTTRLNGLGKPVKGWYVTDYGIPLGPPHKNKSEAIKSSNMYARDKAQCIKV